MIKTRLRSYLLTFVCIFISSLAWSQQTEDPRLPEVSSLVSFYQYMLNTVGGSKTSARDKEVIISESYKKAFMSKNVQIEDDLLPNRNAITNKDVTAYLRDVDFFFKEIVFEFADVKIEKFSRDNGAPYYLVSFECKINATTLEGAPYKHMAKRYIEINVDETNNDLKIASVYTTKMSREKQLRNWWEGLSYEWTRIFRNYVPFDSATDQVLLKIAALDSLDLSGNEMIQDLEPLSALNQLQTLYINDTKILDLNEIRFALKLKKLVAKGSTLWDIHAVQYFENLTYLDLSGTNVQDLSELRKLKNLRHLNLSGSTVINFEPLSGLASLTWLDVSNTSFADTRFLLSNVHLQYLNLARSGVTTLKDCENFRELEWLDASETYITDLSGLIAHPALRELRINQTRVNSLAGLTEALKLEKVYADNTGISEKAASDFMSKRKRVLVITNSEKVIEWWGSLQPVWKTPLLVYLNSKQPGKEELIKLLNIDSLDISGKGLSDSRPLEKFKKLKYLDVSKNAFNSFGFTAEMEYLEALIGHELPVESTTGLEKNKSLQVLDLKGSALFDIQSLSTLNKLQTVDLSNTRVKEQSIRDFLVVNPKTVVLFREEALMQWWNALPSEWTGAFALKQPDSYALHHLTESTDLTLENAPIADLNPLEMFINLHKVVLNKTRVTNLTQLGKHRAIEEISCTSGPLADLTGMNLLQQLKVLNISNTAVEDLRPLEENYALEDLNCSGTNIKNVRGLETLKNLQKLDISNTRVWQINKLYDIRDLKTLICYNTRITDNQMDAFKDQFPNCDVTYY